MEAALWFVLFFSVALPLESAARPKEVLALHAYAHYQRPDPAAIRRPSTIRPCIKREGSDDSAARVGEDACRSCAQSYEGSGTNCGQWADCILSGDCSCDYPFYCSCCG